LPSTPRRAVDDVVEEMCPTYRDRFVGPPTPLVRLAVSPPSPSSGQPLPPTSCVAQGGYERFDGLRACVLALGGGEFGPRCPGHEGAGFTSVP
jgi:hypothetical protein